MRRREALGAGATAVLAAAVGVPAARAALPQPAPAGDDVGFLAFAVVAEGVLAACFDAALGVKGAWLPAEKRLLREAHAVHRANVDRVNSALGPDDQVTPGDFSRQVTIGSRAGALKVGRGLERLAGGTYLGGVAGSTDYGTRLLLGRLLAVATRNEVLLARWAGASLGGLPAPIELDAAGLQLDRYVKEPTP
jgi:hypothetical protein